MADNSAKKISLSSRSADSQKKAHGLPSLLSLNPRLAVRLHIGDNFMIHIVSRINELVRRNGP